MDELSLLEGDVEMFRLYEFYLIIINIEKECESVYEVIIFRVYDFGEFKDLIIDDEIEFEWYVLNFLNSI